MANPEHLAILKQGVERWKSWRQEHSEVTPQLPNCDLRGDWIGDTFSQISLRAADLRGADFRRWICEPSTSVARISRQRD